MFHDHSISTIQAKELWSSLCFSEGSTGGASAELCSNLSEDRGDRLIEADGVEAVDVDDDAAYLWLVVVAKASVAYWLHQASKLPKLCDSSAGQV